ncbi:MAG TPA: T9SS type A sorting domain-containing protein [Flavipsychrobacter sp.]|nr:T9SS type A sorting domain-containing protein [Flavipsychrobacter sp.]
MKRSFLLFSAVAGMLYLTLSSNSFGPASSSNGNRTGSPGSAGTCGSSGCHSVPSANTTGLFIVADATAPTTPVTSYTPGHNYIVALSGNNATKANFGFQAIVLRQSNNTQVGTITTTDAKTHVPSGYTALIEHNQRIGKTQGVYAVTFNWTAPAAGTGPVTIYGIINAVNSDGGVAGDEPSNTFSQVLTEIPTSVASLSQNIKITAYPNPATSNVNIKMEGAENGTYTINVMDVTGRTIQTESLQVNGENANISLQTGNWASGLHFAQIIKDGAQRMIPIVKQ